MLDSETTRFHVVINDEHQYSIWPDSLPLPAGWRMTGCTGNKSECLEYIGNVWTDMRPLSLRKFMAESTATVGDPPLH